MESRLNIPVPPKKMMMGVRSLATYADRWSCPYLVRGVLIGKSVSKSTRHESRGSFGRTYGIKQASKKYSLIFDGDRTKTDTGGWEEDSQAREITLVKELGKLTP